MSIIAGCPDSGASGIFPVGVSLLCLAAIVTAFTDLGDMSRQLFGMVVIQGRKRWVQGAERSPR